MADPAVPVSEFLAYLGRPTGAAEDPIAEGQLAAAEELVSARLPYDLTPTTEQRTVWTSGESIVRLPGGLRSATEVLLDGAAITEDHYRLVGLSGRPFHVIWVPWGSRMLKITGDWGFEECPAALRNAIKAIAARDHFTRLNRQADVVQGADGGGSSYFDRIPSAARQAIEAYSVIST